MTTARLTFTIGRIFAGQFRRGLRDFGLDYDEDKGWLLSHFIVRGEYEKVQAFREAAQKWNES